MVGEKYPLIVKAVTEAIEHLPEIIPGYTKETGYEIIGFFWNQGESDMSPEASAEYEKNLVNLITDLRKDFKAPDMKVVIAITGFDGRDWSVCTEETKEAIGKVIDAQLALPDMPGFKGSAATAETRDFYRPQDPFGGNKQDHPLARQRRVLLARGRSDGPRHGEAARYQEMIRGVSSATGA